MKSCCAARKTAAGKRKEFLGWIKALALGAAVGLAINCTLIVNATVPTGSMEGTIMPGNRVIGSRLAYAFSEPERGDVIIFPFPDDESTTYIKRIVGLPGETIQIVDGRVYLDGADKPLEEPYLPEKPTGDFGPLQIPEDCYFVMGDNRNHSGDARFWKNPFVKKEKIRAKANFCYFPDPHMIE